MPRPAKPSNPGTDFQKLDEAADVELDKGVAEVSWSADNRDMLFLFHNHLYSMLPGQTPNMLAARNEVTMMKPSPTDHFVAYVADAEIYLVSVTGSDPAPRRLTIAANPNLAIEDVFWSSDGKALAFIESDESQVPLRGIPDYLAPETTMDWVRRPFPGEPSARRRLGVVSSDGKSPVRWIDLGGNPTDQIFNVAWSPDSRTILVDKSDLYIKHRKILLVDADSGEKSVLLREDDPKNVTAEWWADWSPDGGGIYFTSDRDNYYHVYYLPRTGGQPRDITPGEGAVFSPSISQQGKALFYLSNGRRPEERQLYRSSLTTGLTQRITQSPGTHAATISPDGTLGADYFSNDLTPPDVYLVKTSGDHAVSQITHSPLPGFKDQKWVGAKYVTFPSTADGVTLHGRLTLPPGFDKSKHYPAILGSVYSNTVHNQWGGRLAHPTWGLDQYLAQQGYVLLNVDIRGSLGYGKAFRQRLALAYGGIDVEDLYSGVKFLQSQGFVDRKRIGMWGSSYGGLLTTTSLFTHPGVYKAGVAGAPATSLFHALTGEMQTMMDPQTHQIEYAKASAFLKSGALQDHLMIIHGMRDQTVLFKDSVSLVQRLIMQGKDVQFVVLPDASHSWDTGATQQTLYAYHQLIDYFQRYLGDGHVRE